MNTIPASTVIASRYRVLRELGRGGMGVVYLVEHTRTGDWLALKLLIQHAGARAEQIERFKREARAPARIRSDHVVRVVDADVAPELGGAPFLVMELLDGEDLDHYLARRRRLAPNEVMLIVAQAALALEKAHKLGIVHRDLKPENLFLHRRESGETIVKVVDFGISKLAEEGRGTLANAALTKTGAIMGTPLYMSPEQARGRTSEIGPATDIWALALIVFRLLTGTIYWRSETLADLLVEIVRDTVQPPSSRAPWLSPEFDAWFLRSTMRAPEERFASVAEQVAALGHALGHTIPVAAPAEIGILEPTPLLTSTPPVIAPAVGRSTRLELAGSTPIVSAGSRSSRALALGIGSIALVAMVALSVVAVGRVPRPQASVEGSVQTLSLGAASLPVLSSAAIAEIGDAGPAEASVDAEVFVDAKAVPSVAPLVMRAPRIVVPPVAPRNASAEPPPLVRVMPPTPPTPRTAFEPTTP